MSESVIKVENLSKQYRLGEVGTGTLAHDLNRWWHRMRGKEDPYLLVGEENDRETVGNSEYVWSLRDINFEVKQGEVLGIIGKNGAGKSTLLKILSRTTTPTSGSIKLKGRVASLLEVGTGFHPELSGRDNIFLNGSILGMSKSEIKSKFDEIVDFAKVDRYIDTPVKRYSSGMYVRLAFAVAAHLDPEILIVDEVLAVGDAEFQQKCLGKMRDVSINEGKTILFVSHSMAAVRNLCNRVIHLKNGSIQQNGDTAEVVNSYLTSNNTIKTSYDLSKSKRRSGSGVVQFLSMELRNEDGEVVNTVLTGDNVTLVFKLRASVSRATKIDLGFSFHNAYDEVLAALYSSYQDYYIEISDSEYINVYCVIPEFPFSAGQLVVRGRIEVAGEESDWPSEPLGIINIETGDFFRTSKINNKITTPFLMKGIWDSRSY
ncbi:ABC-type polysaccharide/polyol phosphate transport system ATPase subunit [Pontibacter ummariensis]|uniref:ABC-type polysaccharide/polyol phosphate transport system, ATPase component n=1 Tax=Pontibacter ummariensis TaxID=1610492 RepID=A0A239BMJ3_9BACT|nr:polysaccharide ABC transporter ATP-binding protein [Pontibacter ummariensis]PRY15777.1 ABC-type polysaccharide/polyol phosphate transport system ATPase subunit [Pontibacter ummariensis]SNS08568.1 ABC-type polysaccharide/polyol phosphate transport system, ATPase component [Pontibacter ummariensis]